MYNNGFLIQPYLLESLPRISHGRGIYLYDQTGKEYIDGSSGAVTASIGHGVEKIVQAMTDQANKVSFVYRSQFTSEAAEKLASKLSEWCPGNVNWSFFVNSGSEATETAMKIAIQYWQEKGLRGKNKVISRWGSYHGITMGALSMSGHVLRRKRFIPILDSLPQVAAPYCYRCPLGLESNSCQAACTKDLETAILRIGSDNIAAFIAEPIIGAAAGALMPSDTYYQEIRRLCDKYNILFIADEVMTGIGRTGEKMAINHWNVIPDIIALGKGMGAGYTPIAAAIVADPIIDTIANGSGSIMSGHTYSANPQSCAVALAVIEFIEEQGLVSNAKTQGEYLLKKLQALMKEMPIIGDIRGKGLLYGVELVADPNTKTPYPLEASITKRLIDAAMTKGLLIYPASGGIEGIAGDAVILAPPLTIKEQELDKLIHLFKESILELQRNV